MDRGRTGFLAGVAALAAAALVSAGCGSGGALSLDPVASAATTSQNAGAAHIRYTMAFSHGAQQFALEGSGVIDGTSADLTFDLGAMLSRMGLPANATGGATPSQLANAKMEEVLLKQGGDYVIYLRFPDFLAAQIPGGKQWAEMNLSKLGPALGGADLNQLMSGSQFSPTDMLSMLEAEGATVDKVGTTTIGGVPTTHYAVKVDVAKAFQSKGLTSPLLKAYAGKIPTIPVDVYVDRSNLVRREQMTMSLRGVSMRMTMDMSDYGTPATITAPPSSDVFDLTSLVAAQLHSSHP